MCLWDRIECSKSVDRAPDPELKNSLASVDQCVCLPNRRCCGCARFPSPPNHGRRAQRPCTRDAHCAVSGPACVLTPPMPVGRRCLSLFAAQPGNRTAAVKDSNHSKTTMSDLGGVRTGKLPFPFQDYKERYLVRVGTGRKYGFTYEKIDEYGFASTFVRRWCVKGRKRLCPNFCRRDVRALTRTMVGGDCMPIFSVL